MRYLEIGDYHKYIFKDIRSLVYDDVQKPQYELERNGIQNLESTLGMIRNNDYYPTYHKKAAFLFSALSTGHIFSNGNKRMALFSLTYFEFINRYKPKSIKRKSYTNWFKKHFPLYKTSRLKFNSNFGWALYNLNKAINIKYEENNNGHKYNFDQIKEICEEFLHLFTIKE